MCSIIGSFSKAKIIELAGLNKYRGTFSHSISLYDPEERAIFYIQRTFGELNYDQIEIPDNMYCIVHQQAPTGEDKSEANIHPAETNEHLLWHNGILKDYTIERLNNRFGLTKWDSQLLLQKMIADRLPDDIDGSFSCLYYNPLERGLFLFRNALAPMFIDNQMNISSTKFEGSKPTKSGVKYAFFPEAFVLQPLTYFETVNNPYQIS